MNFENILVLTGGTGTVKLINGLYELYPENLNIITNTADDFSFYGLYVSPDTDAVLYSLSNLLDKQKMWGLSNDTFSVKNTLQGLDTDKDAVASWFNLGDKDLAYCLYRSFLLQQGKTLTETVSIVAKKLGIKCKIFPMADSPVGTYFITHNGKEFHLEEFFIRLRTKPPIKRVHIKGTENVLVSSELINAISLADLVIIGPSNPISSIGPILKIDSIRKEILRNQCPKLVISPIVGSSPVSGPAHKYMKAQGYDVSALGIYSFYQDIGTHFLFDYSDQEKFKMPLQSLKIDENQKILFDDIVIPTKEKQVALARKITDAEYKFFK